MAKEKAEALARSLVGVYFQTSIKHRTVGKLPDGMTGIVALAKASKRRKWAELLGERSAGDHFLRVYGTETLTLDIETWIAYKRLGGGTYNG